MPGLDRSILGEVADDVQLGPFCVVAEGARIGAGSRLGAHVIVHPGTSVGAGCEVQDGAVLGKPPKLARHSRAAGAPVAALTVEASAMAKVPLAGTDYIPGLSEERALDEIRTLLDQYLENPVD